MKSKVIALKDAVSQIKDGDTVMIGGFLGNGVPRRLLAAIAQSGVKDLTLICNDTGIGEEGVGELVKNKQFSRILASHIGTNKETGRQMNEKETVVELIPQGTLIEQIRSGAYGLGGVLTPTGIGTLVEEGKDKLVVNGEEYLVELPLKANVALVFANKADEVGNLQYTGSENNFNHLMAANANITIVEAREVVPTGSMNNDFIHTPGIFVNYVVEGV